MKRKQDVYFEAKDVSGKLVADLILLQGKYKELQSTMWTEKHKKENKRLLRSDAIESLYQLNAWISGRFITKLHKINTQDIENTNRTLGAIIKVLRENN